MLFSKFNNNNHWLIISGTLLACLSGIGAKNAIKTNASTTTATTTPQTQSTDTAQENQPHLINDTQFDNVETGRINSLYSNNQNNVANTEDELHNTANDSSNASSASSQDNQDTTNISANLTYASREANSASRYKNDAWGDIHNVNHDQKATMASMDNFDAGYEASQATRYATIAFNTVQNAQSALINENSNEQQASYDASNASIDESINSENASDTSEVYRNLSNSLHAYFNHFQSTYGIDTNSLNHEVDLESNANNQTDQDLSNDDNNINNYANNVNQTRQQINSKTNHTNNRYLPKISHLMRKISNIKDSAYLAETKVHNIHYDIVKHQPIVTEARLPTRHSYHLHRNRVANHEHQIARLRVGGSIHFPGGKITRQKVQRGHGFVQIKRDLNSNNRLKHLIPKHTVLKVVKKFSLNNHIIYQVKYGHHKYLIKNNGVRNAYLQTRDFPAHHIKNVIAKRTLTIYRPTNNGSTIRVGYILKGMKVGINHVTTVHGYTRLEISPNCYITANRNFVKVVKPHHQKLEKFNPSI